MTSFVDLLGNDIWSERDIVARTEAMIAAEFPPEEVAILNRKYTASQGGLYELTDEEQAEVLRYMQVCQAAKEAGDAARADMGLLLKTMEYERAMEVVANADEATVELAALRNPEPEEAGEPEQAPEEEGA